MPRKHVPKQDPPANEHDVYYDNRVVGRVQGLEYQECYQKAMTLCQGLGITIDPSRVRLSSQLKKSSGV